MKSNKISNNYGLDAVEELTRIFEKQIDLLNKSNIRKEKINKIFK